MSGFSLLKGQVRVFKEGISEVSHFSKLNPLHSLWSKGSQQHLGGGDFDPEGRRGNVCKHPWGEQRKLPASNARRSGRLLPRLPRKESPTTENYPANNVSSSRVRVREERW